LSQNTDSTPPEYSEESFWDKLKHFAASAGKDVVEKALVLYFALQSNRVPAWAKTVIVGALAYFISPVDAIPDLLPIVGYTDDLGALAAALGMVAVHIDDDMRKQAKQKLCEWFGP